jgi:hypothetical protein
MIHRLLYFTGVALTLSASLCQARNYSESDFEKLLGDYRAVTNVGGESEAARKLERAKADLYAQQERNINLYIQAVWIYRIRRKAEPGLTISALVKRNKHLDPFYLLHWGKYLSTKKGKSEHELKVLEPWFALKLADTAEAAGKQTREAQPAATTFVEALRDAKKTLKTNPKDKQAKAFVNLCSYEKGLFTLTPTQVAEKPDHPVAAYCNLARQLGAEKRKAGSHMEYSRTLKAGVEKHKNPTISITPGNIRGYVSSEQYQKLRELWTAETHRAANALRPAIESRIKQEQASYVKLLGSEITKGYHKRLLEMSDSDTLLVMTMRRKWQPYIVKPFSAGATWRQDFLNPVMDQVRPLLVVTPASLNNSKIDALRESLMDKSDLLKEIEERLKIEKSDPVAGMKSPTGIDIPKIDNPQTYADYLKLLERTLAMTYGFAGKTPRALLMKNLENSKIFDVGESDFICSSNEVRMSMGSYVWVGDPLLIAAARDHCYDLKAGLASGHMSNVEGKRGFTHRATRMGARRPGSEGIGGGRTGEQALRGLSYSGTGHGGPLFGSIRNVVGSGTVGGTYTCKYATDKSLWHMAPAIDNYWFLPPGFEPDDAKRAKLPGAFNALQEGDRDRARRMLESYRPKSDTDTIMAKFMLAACDADAKHKDWTE